MESRNLSRLPPFDKKSGALNIIVETPKNGRIKYKYNENFGMFQFDKTLPYGFSFPFEFGFVPTTRAEMEILWMCWSYPMKQRFQDASSWAKFWEYYKRNSEKENG
jgi:hypothetical protein